MKKVLVISGPTSTGKTDLALDLAGKFNGELVSCDSRQVYKGLDIGTGKYPNEKWTIENGQLRKEKGYWEINGIKVWMYDVVKPDKQYTVADYVKEADRIIEDIIKRGKLPIVAGGTGLYLKALIDGLPNLELPVDKKLRKQLELFTKAELQEKLRNVSRERWLSLNNSDKENPRRLIRYIELALVPHSQGILLSARNDERNSRKDILKIGLTAQRQILYERSDRRVMDRIDQGMIKEAEILLKKGVSIQRMKQLGLEYGVLADYLQGIIDKQELINILKVEIHGFIKHQLTWFKKEKDVHWFDITDLSLEGNVEKLVAKWYYLPHET